MYVPNLNRPALTSLCFKIYHPLCQMPRLDQYKWLQRFVFTLFVLNQYNIV